VASYPIFSPNPLTTRKLKAGPFRGSSEIFEGSAVAKALGGVDPMAAPVIGDSAPADGDVHTVVSADTPGNVQPCVSAAAKTLGGAGPMEAPVMGNGAPAKGDAPTEDDRDEADDEVEDFVWGGSEDAPTEDDRGEAGDEVEDFVWGGSEKTPPKSN
jgi:hypothetical protein